MWNIYLYNTHTYTDTEMGVGKEGQNGLYRERNLLTTL